MTDLKDIDFFCDGGGVLVRFLNDFRLIFNSVGISFSYFYNINNVADDSHMFDKGTVAQKMAEFAFNRRLTSSESSSILFSPESPESRSSQ